MTRVFTVLAVILCLCVASAAMAQEEAHYEGYTLGSDPSAPGAPLVGQGLVTKLFPPLVSVPVWEYTWEMHNMFSAGSVLIDGVYYTTYIVGNPSQINIYEDPSGDATATFYLCPSGMGPYLDPNYSDGLLYLRGHFTSYKSTFDTHPGNYGAGTFTGQLNWDAGAHIGDLPIAQRGGWTFGGTTKSDFSCIPPSFQQAMTGRIFQLTTPAVPTTWGKLKNAYR